MTKHDDGKTYGTKAKSKAIEKAKKMKEGHNRISSDGTITNRLYPGGFKSK